MKKKDIASYTFQELEEEMKLSGEKGFRAKQIYEWIHVKMAESFGEMTNLSKTLREKLDREYLADLGIISHLRFPCQCI